MWGSSSDKWGVTEAGVISIKGRVVNGIDINKNVISRRRHAGEIHIDRVDTGIILEIKKVEKAIVIGGRWTGEERRGLGADGVIVHSFNDGRDTSGCDGGRAGTGARGSTGQGTGTRNYRAMTGKLSCMH
jgi:hypothetical protein